MENDNILNGDRKFYHHVVFHKDYIFFSKIQPYNSGVGSSVGIATDYGLDGRGSNPGGARFSVRRDWPWGPPSLLYNGYRVFPGGKVRPGCAADHSPPSSALVVEE